MSEPERPAEDPTTSAVARTNSDVHNLLGATQIATVFLGRDLHVMRYTPSVAQLFNLTAGDIGRPIGELSHKLGYPDLAAHANRALRNLVPVEREIRDGDHWYLARVLPYRTDDDGIGGVVLTFSDITARRHAESALRESEETFRLIVENAHGYAIFAMDTERRITSWNSGAEALLGYTQKEAIGQAGDIIFTPEDRAAGAPQREAATALAEGRAADERWHVRKDGSRFWASGIMNSMRAADGRTGLLKIFRDQTAERHAKEALEISRAELRAALAETEAARDEAEAAGRAKDRFLAVLSHELRAPLTPLMLAAQILARQKDMPSGIDRTLDIIQRNVQLMAQLVDDLLDVSRIATGKMSLQRVPCRLRDVLSGAVDVAQPDFDARRQTLRLELDPGPDSLDADPKRLQQVFWNLLKNASKFSPEGGVVTLRSRLDGGHARIEVEDVGVGFDPAAAERIFVAFEQGGVDVTRAYGGLGLGLAITRAIVEGHDGQVHAASAGPGRGATFTVDLPLTTVADGRP